MLLLTLLLPLMALGGTTVSVAPTRAPSTSAAPTTTAVPTTAGPTFAPGADGCILAETRPLAPPDMTEEAPTFGLHVSSSFAGFDCNAFFPLLDAHMGLARQQLPLINKQPGSQQQSVDLSFACVDEGARGRISQLMDDVVEGRVDNLRLISARNYTGIAVFPRGTPTSAPLSSGGQVGPSGDDGSSRWIIALVVGLLLGLAGVVVIIVTVARNRRKPHISGGGTYHQPLINYGAGDAAGHRAATDAPRSTYSPPAAAQPVAHVQAAPAPAPRPRPPPRATTKHFLVTGTVDARPADAVIHAPRGSSAVVEMADWNEALAQNSPWVWGRIGNDEGYLAVSLLQEK